jgi:hypothetical protein
MDRKGNIAFLMLPVVALLACTLGIFSYLTLDDNFGENSANLASMASQVNVMQDYIESSAKLIARDYAVSGMTADSLRESASRRDLHIEGEGNFFSKIQNGDFSVSKSGDTVLLEVKDVFIQARAGKEGENLWERRWDVALESGPNGEFIRFINK